MTLVDWVIENITGRDDQSAIYAEMSPKERRHPVKRQTYFKALQAEYDATFVRLFSEETPEKPFNPEHRARVYKYLILKMLFSHEERLLKKHDPEIESATLERIYKWMHVSYDLTKRSWTLALNHLREIPAAAELLPSLFDERFAQGWERAQGVKRAHLAEQEEMARKEKLMEEERARVAEQNRASTSAIRAKFQSELRTLKALFSISSDQMTRYKLSIQIESVENALRRL